MTDRLIIGTDDGLHDLRRTGAGWEHAGRYLAGCEINGVAADRANGRLYVATRNRGLHRLAIADGASERIGDGILPDTMRCVALDPNDPDRIFVGTEPTGVWFTADGGATWRDSAQFRDLAAKRAWQYHVDFIAPHLRYLVVSRADPNHVYGAVQIGGVVRSEDGGETWEDVVEGLDPDVHMLVQDPADADTIYAVCGGGGFPEAGVHPPPPPQGRAIYRSRDRARTWDCISPDTAWTYGVPLRVKPDEPSVLIAGLARGWPFDWMERPERADAAVVVSRDGGATWRRVRDGLPERFTAMVEVVELDPAKPERVYIATGGEAMKMLPEEFRKGEIYVTDHVDRGWRRVPVDLPSIFTLTPV